MAMGRDLQGAGCLNPGQWAGLDLDLPQAGFGVEGHLL